MTNVIRGIAVAVAFLAGTFATPRAQTGEAQGCMGCHAGIESMHSEGDDEIGLTCVTCHGGNGAATTMKEAHVQPRNKQLFTSSANPVKNFAALNSESTRRHQFVKVI